jgi:large exoprotein involved in heme utilization and adhesion
VIDSTNFGAFNAANITVVVSGAVSIAGSGEAPSLARISSIPQNGSTGNAGQVVVQVGGNLTVRDMGRIGADPNGLPASGAVRVLADSISLQNGGAIASATSGAGAGGEVDVTARGHLFISNAGNKLTGISAQSGNGATGRAGNVTVRAASLTIIGLGQIDAATAGAGDAGHVTVRVPGAVLIDGRGGSSTVGISSEAALGSTGKGGQIVVEAGSLTIRNGGQISSATAGKGQGGDVSVTAGSQILLTGPGPQITATSTGAGNAGSIAVSAPRLSLRDGASISTEAQSTDGGNITISASDLVYLQQRSSITTSVKRANGNGGNIAIDPRFVILDRSVIAANAVGGKGGNLLIRAHQFVPSADSAVTATSERKIPGTVTISSQPPNLTGSLVVLASALRATAAVLTESCAAHGADPRSSLVMAGRGGLRHDPGTTLPALYIANRPVGARRNPAPEASSTPPLRTRVSLSARCE